MVAGDPAGGRGRDAAIERAAHPLPRPIARSDARGDSARLLRRRHAGSPTPVANFLSAPVLRLSADTECEHGQESRDGRSHQDRIELRPCAAQVPIARENLGRFSHQPIRRSVCTALSSRTTPRRCGAFPCTEISAEWGAQRIKGLSVAKAIAHALTSPLRNSADAAQKGTETSSDRAIPLSQIRARPDVGGSGPARDRTGGNDPLAAARGRHWSAPPTEIVGVDVFDEASGAIRRMPCDYFLFHNAGQGTDCDVEA